MGALDSARARIHSAGTDAERLHALNELSAILYESDCLEALAVADAALELAERSADDVGAGWALHNRGWALVMLGETDPAMNAQLRALRLFEAAGDRRGLAHALLAIGDIHGDAGDTVVALDYLERGRAIVDEVGDLRGVGTALNLTGIVLSHQGRHEEAHSLFEHAERIFDEQGDELRTATAMVNRGFELVALGHEDEVALAHDLAERIVRLGIRLGDEGRNTTAYGLALAAQVHSARGELDIALGLAGRAREAAMAGGFEPLAVEIALDESAWLARAGRFEEAAAALEWATASQSGPTNLRLQSQAQLLRADVLEGLGEVAAALAAFRQHHELDRRIHGDEADRRARLAAARIEIDRAQQEAAVARERVAELERLERDKREFLASVSHELRTPLAAVVGFSAELTAHWDEFDADDQRDMVRTIAEQADDMAAIVDDLLTITRLEAGTLSIHPQNVDLVPIVADISRSARLGDLTVEGAGRAHADPARVRQILRNLLGNALRHGGAQVRVVVSNGGVTAAVEVRDTGTPIPADQVSRMFEPFQHGAGDGGKPQSVGLGLTVARSLATTMGGDLGYHHDGVESVFRLELPAALGD